MVTCEIESVEQLRRRVAQRGPLSGLRLQDLDLSTVVDDLMQRTDVGGMVVLGGRIPRRLEEHLRAAGALIFPADPSLPFDPWTARAYRPDALYANLSDGYGATPDARTYRWSLEPDHQHDAYATLLRASHDDSISDALFELLDGRRVVGVMGGHALERGSTDYTAAAHLGHDLVRDGALVVTGGGPGAMEAANLGAFAPDRASLTGVLDDLASVPSFRPDVTAWARTALRARAELTTPGGDAITSVGVPTWFYGHEPPNVFVQWSAKLFDNATREDVLLRSCTGGVVVLPGAAGTVQEIFQLATTLYYARPEEQLPPLVLVGHEFWSAQLPVWPLLQALAADRPMAAAITLVADTRAAARAIAAANPTPSIDAGADCTP